MNRRSTRQNELAQAYDSARARLVRIAYATIGSHAEAEDVVSECWLRLIDADSRENVRDVDAWATVVVARAALDVLRSARVRRETYPGPWLPEPVIDTPTTDPLDRVTFDEHVSYALLVMLESLTPAERTSWVLHDLFGLTFTDIATAVGRSPAAVRQLAARARQHVQAQSPRIGVSPAEHNAAVQSFLDAVAGGDLHALLKTLDPDVVLTSDGGGQVSAARRPIYGADKVARFLAGIARETLPNRSATFITLNGQAAIGVYDDEQLSSAFAFTVDGERITRIDIIRAPDKLPSH